MNVPVSESTWHVSTLDETGPKLKTMLTLEETGPKLKSFLRIDVGGNRSETVVVVIFRGIFFRGSIFEHYRLRFRSCANKTFLFS